MDSIHVNLSPELGLFGETIDISFPQIFNDQIILIFVNFFTFWNVNNMICNNLKGQIVFLKFVLFFCLERKPYIEGHWWHRWYQDPHSVLWQSGGAWVVGGKLSPSASLFLWGLGFSCPTKPRGVINNIIIHFSCPTKPRGVINNIIIHYRTVLHCRGHSSLSGNSQRLSQTWTIEAWQTRQWQECISPEEVGRV